MAHTIKSLPPKSKPKKKYDWAKWTNGRVWSLKKGVDFTCEAWNFRGYLNCVAHRRGLAITSRVVGDVVKFQFSAK